MSTKNFSMSPYNSQDSVSRNSNQQSSFLRTVNSAGSAQGSFVYITETVRENEKTGDNQRRASCTIIPMWAFVFVVFLIVFIAKLLSGNGHPTQPVLAAESPPAIKEVTQAFSSAWETTGFLFPDSDIRYLTASDIMALTEIDGWSISSLAQMAINEIYAKHNYLFNSEEILSFFSSYSWYDGYLNAEESAASFNRIERVNISFLKDIKESYM